MKSIKGVFGIALASGLSFAIPELLMAKYMGAELPAILGSITCMVVTIAMAKIFYKDTASKNVEKYLLKRQL